jgi:hypothetical protein
MKLKGFQRGLIFNHFPKLMFFSTGFCDSDSHMFLQIRRLAKDDPSITSDEQFHRDVRANKLTPEEFADGLLCDNETLKNEMLNNALLNECPENIGGWYVLASIITGFKRTVKHKDILKYLCFLEEFCLVDRKYIVQQQDTSTSTPFDTSNQAINLWLETGDIDITIPTEETKAKYLIALVLHWAALYETFLFVQLRALTSDNCDCYSLFLDCLPEIGSNGKLKRSNSMLLDIKKTNWANAEYKKTKMSWVKFHSDIAKARSKQGLSNTRIEDETPDLKKPNQQIKKKLDRWRNGYLKKGQQTLSFISIDDFKQYIDILETPYDPEYYDTASVRHLFINIFEFVQFELQKSSVSDQRIVDEFANYPRYQKLVNKRFEHFIDTGVLEP